MPEVDPDEEVLIAPRQIRDHSRPPFHRLDDDGDPLCPYAQRTDRMDRRRVADCPEKARLCGHCRRGGCATNEGSLASALADADVTGVEDLDEEVLVTDGGPVATKVCRGCGFAVDDCECEDGDRDG